MKTTRLFFPGDGAAVSTDRRAEQNSLVIKGEGEKEPGEEEGAAAAAPRYSGRVELAGDVYRMDQIRAEMKNGVLRVVVPKVKEEQRRDVFQVNVD